jgi:hypothetical protein
MDWFILLTPLLLLGLLVPFVFIGCGLDAVGAAVRDATLSYGGALLPITDPLTVEIRPIFQITARWSLHGRYTILGNHPYDKIFPPQVKGSLALPLPIPLGDDTFRIPIYQSPNVHLEAVRCVCDVVVDSTGTTLTTPVISIPYYAGNSHVFRLVRSVRSVASPSITPVPFRLTGQAVDN